MAHAGSQAAFDDAAWDSYLQAPPEPFALYSEPGGGRGDEAAALQFSTLAQDATIEPRALYSYDPSAFPADASYTHEPQRSYSTGTTPSPALPGLSPASSGSASSSYLGLVSPHQQTTASDYLHGGLQHSASAGDGGLSGGALKGSRGGYALNGHEHGQHSAQRHQHQHSQVYPQEALYQPPHSPAYTHSRPPPSFLAPPAPTTPRRHAAAASTHLYRSPSAYPATSSPATSPYHRPTPRSTASFPSAAASARRGSTSSINESPTRKATPRKVAAVTESVDANGCPTKSIRRVSTLSIEVPPPSSGRRGSLVASMPSSSRPPLAMQPSFSSSQRSAPPSLSASQQLTEASVREVEQLLGELGPILDPSLYEHDGGELSSSTAAIPGPRLPVLDEGASMFSPTSVSISGVTLGEDDFRLLDDAVLGLTDVYSPPQYPQSAPAWQTTFDLPPPPPPSSLSGRWQPHSASSAAQSYALSHSNSVGSLAPPFNPHVRAHSARDAAPSSSSSHDEAYPTSPSVAALRRRSSCHAFVGASQQQPPSSPHRHHAHPHAHQPPTWTSASPSRQPYYPTYERQPLPAVLQPPPDVLRPVTPPPRDVGGLSASTSRPSPMSPKTTPKRKRGSPTKPKQPVAMFVNYSAQDAKKLLNGVAPSGSTKKRREEEDAQRHRGDLSSSVLLDDPASLSVLPLPFATGSHSSAF
ncbi:hypothetical protein JCM9279_002887 [Rhodotorula babjevae]